MKLKRQLLRIALAMILAVLATQSAWSDYLGTISNRAFMDPESLPVVSDGYQVGDIVTFISESTPNPNHSPVGAGAWATVYLASGAVVVNAETVIPNPDGTYSAIPMTDISDTADECGPRGCKFPTSGTLQNGRLNESQQDTGIFYSTDPQTRKLASPYVVSPTGSSKKGPQNVHNQWDYNQVLAYGIKKALSGNRGVGNTPVSQIGGIWYGNGSPVAGPDTYFTNDYDPNCSAANDFELDTHCTGPWQRIRYPNSKKSGIGPVTPTVLDDGNLLNNSVVTNAGHDFAFNGALPSSANALRMVFGERRIGELEYVRVSYQITNVAQFINSINNAEVCFDATGGDTDKIGRGPQDNNWRYYEGNSQICFTGSSNANLYKSIKYIDNVEGAGTALPDSVIGYEIQFSNTGADTIYDIQLTDTPIDKKLTLLAPGSANCPYISYDGNLAGGNPNYLGIAGNTASWATIPSLAPGTSVTVKLCAQVPGKKVSTGDTFINEALASYASISGGASEPTLSSTAAIVVSSKISGTVFADIDNTGTLTAGDIGIEAVSMQLYNDENGDGLLDAGDTLVTTKVTNNAGGYAFTGLEAGDYLVVESAVAYLSNADFDTVIGDCTLGNGCDVVAVTLAGNSANTGNDFSNIGATIGDTIYTDLNGNGLQDAEDTGIEAVTLDLLNSAGVVIATTATDANGLYSFAGLAAGDYTVVVTDTDNILELGVSRIQTGDPDTDIDGATVVSPGVAETIDSADFGYTTQAVDLVSVKSIQVLNDPFNGSTNPKAIPGAELLYTIVVTNTGNGATDPDSLNIDDILPAGTSLFVGDINVAGEGPVIFIQGSTASDVTYNYLTLTDGTDDLEFSNDSGATYTYQPTLDAEGYDQAANALRLSLSGFLGGSDGAANPGFEIRFKVRLQ